MIIDNVAMTGMRWRSMLLAVLLLCAVCGAGGCTNERPYMEVIGVSHADDPSRVLVTVLSGGQPDRWVWSVDARTTGLRAGADQGVEPPLLTRDCAGRDCYRTVPGRLAVQESHDAGQSWTMSWELAGQVYTELATRYPHLGDPAVHLAARSLAVVAVPGGHVVFVDARRDGLLYRSVDGAWHRLGTPMGGEGVFYAPPAPLITDPPPPDPGPGTALAVGVLLLLAAAVVGIIRRSWRWWRILLAVLVAAGVGALAGLGMHLPAVGMFPGLLYGVLLALVLLVVGILLEAVVMMDWRRLSRR